MPQEHNEPSQLESADQTDISTTRKKAQRLGAAGKFWIFFAVLISLISISGAAYIAYRLELQIVPKMATDSQQAGTYGEQIAKLQESDKEHADQTKIQLAQIKAQDSALKGLESTLKSADGQIKAQLDSVINSVSTAPVDHAHESDNWKLEEIIYLLLMGNQRLQVAGDVDTAILIWQVVDEQLQRNSDPRLLAAKLAVENEIGELQKMPSVNLTDIATQLISLTNSVQSLPLNITTVALEFEDVIAEDPNSQNTEDRSSVLNDALSEVWNDVKSLVRIRKVEPSEQLLIKPDMKFYLVENLKLALFTAQSAAIRGEPQVYKSNLEYVQNAINQHYSLDSTMVSEFSEEIRNLINTPIVYDIPDLSGSLQLLQDALTDKTIE